MGFSIVETRPLARLGAKDSVAIVMRRGIKSRIHRSLNSPGFEYVRVHQTFAALLAPI